MPRETSPKPHRLTLNVTFRPLLPAVLLTTLLHAQAPQPAALAEAKRALAQKQFAHAKVLFTAYAKAHPADLQGQLGIADAELGLQQYEAAELGYRRVVAAQPQLWAAHKNLVIVEAALGRWEEFDRERTVLRAARQRGAPGISPHESDIIEVLHLRGQRWIVRDYFEPAGRSQTLYNFERFAPDGRVTAFVSLESASALAEELRGGDVVIGRAGKRTPELSGFALNFYNGATHKTLATYATEPTYERIRADFLKSLPAN